MGDFAELGLQGIPYAIDNYGKVYDPVKDKTKQGVRKVKDYHQRGKHRGDDDGRQNGRARAGGAGAGAGAGAGYDSESDDYSRDRQIARTRTEPRRSRSRRRGGEVVEEKRIVRTKGGRTKSVDRYHRGGGSRRDYSDSEASMSPRPRDRKRRSSLGERAFAALGLGSAAAAVRGSSRRRRGDRSYSSSRSRSRDDGRARRRNRSPSQDSYYSSRRGGTAAAAAAGAGAGAARAVSSRGYDDDRTPSRYKPSGYSDDRDRGDSESALVRRNNTSTVSRSERPKASRRSSSTSTGSSSSSVCSSSEDERKTRKMRGKEYLTAGLAAVATIHAAHNVYQSMEARDKRHMEVLRGEMTPEDAKKKKHKARVQDAAAIGIAALGIKGAYSEWREVQEAKNEMKEAYEAKEKNHARRQKKIEKYGQLKPSDRNADPGSRRRARSEGRQ